MATQEEMNKRLINAAIQGNVNVLRDCILKGAQIDFKDGYGQTLLHLAAWKGHIHVVALLITSKACLFVADNMGQTPLHLAARHGHHGVVEYLFKKGASLSAVTVGGMTPLHGAASNNNTDVVNFLITEGASLSQPDKAGVTPLHFAAYYGNAKIVELLLNKEANQCAQNNEGKVPLHLAAMHGKTEVVRILLTKDAPLSAVDLELQTSLHLAAMMSYNKIVSHLLQKNAPLSEKDNQGKTPLHRAVLANSKKVVVLLLNAGDIHKVENDAFHNAKDDGGQTPLHIAVSEGFPLIVDCLLNSGASPLVVNNEGQTPLHLAARKNRNAEVDLLLKKGAPLCAQDNVGQTPLHKAAWEGSTDVVDRLLKEGAQQHIQDNVGQTPLHLAASNNNTEVVNLLCRNAQSLNATNNEGKTAYDVASDVVKETLQKFMDEEETIDMPSNRDKIVAQSTMSDEIKQPLLFKSYENCVYLGGACNVEKSTLASILIGEEISQHCKSNDGLNSYFGRNGIDVKSKKMVPLKQATMQEGVKQEIKEGTYKIEIAPSDLVDFGRQMSFNMTHQLLMRNNSTFVLMFDFSFPLKEYEEGETTESILKHWVNSIFSYCADDEDILPTIMFSATYSDELNQEDSEDRKTKLIHDLGEIFKNHKRQHRIIYNEIFFINGQKKNDAEITNLRSKLVEVACNQKSWGKLMPMSWVPLELQMSELRLHNINIISKEELITLNQRNDDLALTGEQIEEFLNNQHSLGKIIYFNQQGLDQFIIVQPQSLVNIVRSFITAEHFWPEDKELKGILCTLTNTGTIAKQYLLKLLKFYQHMPSDDFKEFIIQVLVHLDILVESKHYIKKFESEVQSYLVPWIVKNRVPVTDFFDKPVENMICLSYTLLKSPIPAALFCKLIGVLMNVWPIRENPEGICLYHQATIFCIDGSNELHLLVKDDKVFVYLINNVSRYLIPPNIASTVQECLTCTMTKVLESLSISEVSKAFEIKVGECCTSGGVCYISVLKAKERREWICNNNRKHHSKYPLYWLFQKNQNVCAALCPGLNEQELALHPEDKHLFRLANRISRDKFHKLVDKLGLPESAWSYIQDTNINSWTDMRFMALCAWKEHKLKAMTSPSFKELSEALDEEDVHNHVICQIFMEDVTIYDIANSALQEIPGDDVLGSLSKHVGNCAMHLGVELGLNLAEIEVILFKYPKSMFKQTLGVMEKWKSSRKVRTTILMLMKAFQSADGRGLAFLINEYGVKEM